jgi:hypothetical protein
MLPGRVVSVDWLLPTALAPVSFALAGALSKVLAPRSIILAGALAGGAIMVALLRTPGVRGLETAPKHSS